MNFSVENLFSQLATWLQLDSHMAGIASHLIKVRSSLQVSLSLSLQ